MVARMMRWPPWPPVHSKKFHVKLVLLRLEAPAGSQREPNAQDAESEVSAGGKKMAFSAEVRWKGPKTTLASLRRPSIKRNSTKATEILEEGADISISGLVPVVEWNEEFRGVCCLTPYKDHSYHPWEIAFSVLESTGSPSRKMSIIGSASLNLSEFVSAAEEQEIPVNILLSSPAASPDPRLSLRISLSLEEVKPVLESPAARSIVPMPLSPASSPPPEHRDELSALKAGLRKVKLLTDLVSSSRRSSKKEDDASVIFDSSSPDDEEDGLQEDEEEEDGEKEEFVSMRKSFSYGSLASANHLGEDNSDWYYYRSSFGSLSFPEATASSPSSKRGSIILWKKRKLSFRSPKSRGEPLLKKAYAEDGGDDIDHDRRQLSSSDCESPSISLVRSDFGDEDGGFAVGRWEEKQVRSRDGRMNLKAQVFFASMDQRSEEASGESACAALVAVIADWLLRSGLPVKSQFDGLIREGSREWRRLCEDSAFRLRFPDRHLDLDTILQARVRPLALLPTKSFVGFFHPEDAAEPTFSFLSEAMSFDGIWDEVSKTSGVYIVSWNDHFFVLKAEEEAYYIVDTLGERLHEGCNQAYILKFDGNTVITRGKENVKEGGGGEEEEEREEENEKEKEEVSVVVCEGKGCCKEYMKSFLAAIPVRELQEDIKKGLVAASNGPLHQRLQIEFHFAEPRITVNDWLGGWVDGWLTFPCDVPEVQES